MIAVCKVTECDKSLFSILILCPSEVIGAMVSVLVIWVLTGVLVYEAILRVIHRNFTVDPNIMLITAGSGLFVNVL